MRVYQASTTLFQHSFSNQFYLLCLLRLTRGPPSLFILCLCLSVCLSAVFLSSLSLHPPPPPPLLFHPPSLPPSVPLSLSENKTKLQDSLKTASSRKQKQESLEQRRYWKPRRLWSCSTWLKTALLYRERLPWINKGGVMSVTELSVPLRLPSYAPGVVGAATGLLRPVLLFVGCLASQQHANVSQGRICLDKLMCCHTEVEVADQTFYLT